MSPDLIDGITLTLVLGSLIAILIAAAFFFFLHIFRVRRRLSRSQRSRRPFVPRSAPASTRPPTSTTRRPYSFLSRPRPVSVPSISNSGARLGGFLNGGGWGEGRSGGGGGGDGLGGGGFGRQQQMLDVQVQRPPSIHTGGGGGARRIGEPGSVGGRVEEGSMAGRKVVTVPVPQQPRLPVYALSPIAESCAASFVSGGVGGGHSRVASVSPREVSVRERERERDPETDIEEEQIEDRRETNRVRDGSREEEDEEAGLVPVVWAEGEKLVGVRASV